MRVLKGSFFEYKSHKIAQRLRDINGEATSLKINGKATRVWSIPSFSEHLVNIRPAASANAEPPF